MILPDTHEARPPRCRARLARLRRLPLLAPAFGFQRAQTVRHLAWPAPPAILAPGGPSDESIRHRARHCIPRLLGERGEELRAKSGAGATEVGAFPAEPVVPGAKPSCGKVWSVLPG
jgi:hypothetical protein